MSPLVLIFLYYIVAPLLIVLACAVAVAIVRESL